MICVTFLKGAADRTGAQAVVLPGSLTFILAVTRRVLTLLDEDLCCCVQSHSLSFGHQEKHDELLTHDAQRFVLSVAPSCKTRGTRETDQKCEY